MTTIKIKTSREYDVHIGKGLLHNAASMIDSATKFQTAVIVTDEITNNLHAHALEMSLSNENRDFIKFVIPGGEQSKSSEVYIELLEFLASNQITRSDCIVALGGGVVGDLTGFVAATYLRGIPFVQIPTTLLSAVDSSVGGKTAINLKSGKNLAGAFYQPNLVICDISTLETLSEREFINGCAEVIKYGFIADQGLISILEESGLEFDREQIIARCVENKQKIVASDEFDKGVRQLLNLGHTIGHAIEKCSKFEIPHGFAVATGMAIVAKASAKSGYCSKETKDRIISLIEKFKLPTTTQFTASELYSYCVYDKKRSGKNLTIVLPKLDGESILKTIKISELKDFIEKGLN